MKDDLCRISVTCTFLRRNRAPFLWQRSSKLSAHYAASATVASTKAATTTPKIDTNRYQNMSLLAFFIVYIRKGWKSIWHWPLCLAKATMLLGNRETQSAAEMETMETALLPLYLNLSLTELRLDSPRKALKYGNKALEIDSANTKALFRCGQVRHRFFLSTHSFIVK